MVDEVHTHVKEMLEVGAICPSQSLWHNAVVLVCKKDWSLYFCIGFYKLNARTNKDSYPLQQIQEAIKSLVGTGYFSCLDFKAVFWQITMDKASKQYTAFTIQNLGFLSANTCCLGCVMTWWLSKDWCRNVWVNWTWCTVWFTWMSWLSFQKQKRNTYNACALCLCNSGNTIWSSSQPSMSSSRMISTIWLIMSPRKVYILVRRTWRSVAEFAFHPKAYIAIWAFLGLVGHYQWFIKGFAHACIQPLHKHLSGEGAGKKNEHVMHTWKMCWVPLKCLGKLVLRPLSWPLLTLIKPFLLETDASKLGLGAVLSQKQTDCQHHSGSIHKPVFNCSWA